MAVDFHSFCETLLKEVDANRVALEQVDHWILLRRNLARLKLDKFRRLAEPGQFLSDFIQFFSRCQDELVSSDDYQAFADQLSSELAAEKDSWMKTRARNAPNTLRCSRKLPAPIAPAKKSCARNGRWRSTALSPKPLHCFSRATPKNAGSYRNAFKHILVDEFQDTNIAQLELLHLLSAIAATSSLSATTIRPSTASVARPSVASNCSLQRFADWQEGQVPHPSVSR